jgi:hypothetical protein
MTEYTAEYLTERWEAYNEITNIAGLLNFHELLRETDEIFETLWSREKDDISIGVNDGYYAGRDAVKALFQSLKDYDLERAKVAKALHPDEFEGRQPEELRGVGSLNVLNFTTPVVEIAQDGETAKGLWYITSGDVQHYSPAGPAATNRWGKVAIDFVREEAGWRIWHLLYLLDTDAPMGADWALSGDDAAAETEAALAPEYAALANFERPQPNVKTTLYEKYHSRRKLVGFPQIPEAYATFTETFSYGAGTEV